MNSIEIIKRIQQRYKNIPNKTEQEENELKNLNQVLTDLHTLKNLKNDKNLDLEQKLSERTMTANYSFKIINSLKKEKKEIKECMEDILKDYNDTSLLLFDYIEAMTIIKYKPFVVIIGLDKFKWNEKLQEYVYIEEIDYEIYSLSKYEFELLLKTLDICDTLVY